MSFAETVLLGALAGFTIFLILPFGRLQMMSNRMRVGLAMFAVGVLAFLFVDIFEHALEIVEEPVEASRDGEQGIGKGLGLLVLLGAGFAAGSAGLATLERWMRPKGPDLPPIAGGSVDVLAQTCRRSPEARSTCSPSRMHNASRQTPRAAAGVPFSWMTIAAAIGLHNFAEGLATGVSASTGEIALATVLIIGCALHNATEGFGIIGPLGPVRPS